MAELYLARVAGASSAEPPLVIKRILPDLSTDPQFIEMFIAEARITAQLVHPNVVSVVEISEEPGNYFYAMEYVRGSDLLELMRALSAQHRTVPLECAVAIAISVCAALEHAHTLTDRHRRPLEIIHRDISLGNILLGYDGSVKLADFGVMRHGGRAATEPGILKGKLGYMSPEQASGAALDHRTDLFALGIVLYEMTTGERLFPPGDRDEATLARIMRCAITPPTELMFEYPIDLAAIVMTALARDPNERYVSARAMQRDLQAWLRVHGKTAGPRMIGELVTRTFPIASPRPRPNDSTEIEALVGSLAPLPPRTISTEIKPVSPAEPALSPPQRPTIRERPGPRAAHDNARPTAPPRSRAPAIAILACAFTGIALAAWVAWTDDSPAALTTAAAAHPSPALDADAEIRELTALPAASAAIARLALQGAATADLTTVAQSDSERVLAALRACYPSPARELGTDVEVAFELLDTRIETRVGTEGLDRLASCAQQAAGLLDEQAVVVTITFRPAS